MSNRFATRLAAALVGVSAVIAGGTAVARFGAADPAPAPASAVSAALETGQLQGQLPTRDQVSFWQTRVDANPADYLSRAQLANSLLGLAREVGDPAAYREAEVAASDALAANTTYQPARVTLAATRFSLHDFAGARDLALEVLAADPGRLDATAMLADAHLELGEYDKAATGYAELDAAAPGAAVTARRARVAFLEGRSAEAVTLAANAHDQARRSALSPTAEAWYPTQTARYARLAGDLDRAQSEIDQALKLGPNSYVVLAEAGRVAAARDQDRDAVALLSRATAMRPEPADLALLADVQTSLGMADDASRTEETIDFIADLGTRQGQLYNRQYVLFLADRSAEPEQALSLAAAELTERRDVYGFDAHAWAAYRAGRLDEARTSAAAALALGTKDPMLLFHAGVIAKAAGSPDEARSLLREALDISPRFDPRNALVAEAALKDLERTR